MEKLLPSTRYKMYKMLGNSINISLQLKITTQNICWGDHAQLTKLYSEKMEKISILIDSAQSYLKQYLLLNVL